MALPIKHRDFWTAVTAPFKAKFGEMRPSDFAGFDLSQSNAYVQRGTSNDGTQDIDLLGTDTYDRIMVGGYHIRPLRTVINFNLQTSASQATQRFFIADQPYEIRAIALQYDTADGATNTGFITKEVAGQAPGTGVSVQTGTFNLNTTANVVQVAALPARQQPGIFGPQEAVISVNTGEMLSFKMASAVTSLAGLNISLAMLPENSFAPAVFAANANAAIATQVFWLANRPVTITGVSMVWKTAATDASAVTVTVTKDTGTTAPGAGTSVLTAVQSVKGAINIPVNPALAASAATLLMAAGDRLSIKTAGTLTALAGLVVVVSFANMPSAAFTPGAPIAGMQEVVLNQPVTGAVGTAQSFFIADRDYQIYDVSGTYSTAGGSGATVNVTVDGSTVAPGAGTAVGTAVVVTTTANTTWVETLSVSKRTIFLPAGSRLSVLFAGTTSPLAGNVIAVSLLPL